MSFFQKLPLALNIALLLACLLTGYKNYADMQAFTGENVLYLAPIPDRPAYVLSLNDAEVGAIAIEGFIVSYEHTENAIIRNDSRSVSARLTMTETNYFTMNNLSFISGGGWRSDYNDSNVAVLSENAAWELFGGIDILGNHIEIGGEFHSICGITKQESLAETAFVWMPYSLDANDTAITGIYIKGHDYNRLGILLAGESFAKVAGLGEMDYQAIDLNQYRQNLLNKFNLLAIVVSAYVSILFLMISFRRLTNRSKADSIIYGILALASATFCVCLVQYTLNNLALSAEIFTAQSFWDVLSNSDVLGTTSASPYSISRLAEMNEKSMIPLIVGVVAFINIIVLNLASLKGGEPIGKA
ncbi:ABC transporter permease [Tyzzerella sp. OttesenSCG-928-J15]|nr:ABC transporter permease [Tyzzerella sp. OttesenSCG-928-J15]